jgi:hypothetical protein
VPADESCELLLVTLQEGSRKRPAAAAVGCWLLAEQQQQQQQQQQRAAGKPPNSTCAIKYSNSCTLVCHPGMVCHPILHNVSQQLAAMSTRPPPPGSFLV